MIPYDTISVESDEGLLSVANYALKLLKKETFLTKPNEVSASFIIRLAVELFGSGILPYPQATCFLHYYENLLCVLRILSSEIDVELDHIDPREVLRGSRQSISNLLEIMTAFILHCVHEDLLEFDDPSLPAASFTKPELVDGSPIGIELSHSPELPRSVGRVYAAPHCVRNLTHGSPTMAKSTYDSGVPRTYATDDTTAPLSRATHISSDTQSMLATNSDLVPKHRTPSPVTLYPRLPSILSMQLPDSPPTTPKDADNIMEIVRHPSPQSAAPSLSCSPISRLGRSDTVHPDQSAPLKVQLDRPTVLRSCDSTDVRQTKSQINSTLLSVVLSEDDQTRYRHKVSSSSSGCGPSPTPTAPGASASSAPSIPSASPPLQATPQITDPISAGLPNSVNVPPESFHNRRYSGYTTSHDQSCPTTGSILNWTEVDQTEGVTGVLDEFTSFLSSSVHSRLDAIDSDKIMRPSASVLISRTERFTQALQARLDYLRTISYRASGEAKAVADLVNAIGLQCSTTAKITSQCSNGLYMNSKKQLLHPDELQDTLYRILMGVNILLHNQQSGVTLPGQKQDKTSSIPTRKYQKDLPRARATHESRPKRVPRRRAHPILDYSSDSEFEDLLGVKHKLMVDALRHCRLELNSPSYSTRNGVRCPRCKLLV